MATFGNPYGSSYTSFSTLAPETAPAAEKVRRHPKYYLNGGDIHFLVENYIFRVHRYFFERESAVFREKLNIPPPPGANPRGSSDSNPIPLDDVREEDFSRFLWVFYNPKYSIYDANVDEWSSILKLSYDWRFAEVKRLSTRYLETFEIDPIQKIELYQLHEIDKRLLIPSYMALINRQEPLSIVEGRRLSLETALMIATARECARGKPLDSGKHSPTVASVNKESMVEIIKDVFGLKDATPSSPNLEPIYEGTGPGSFSATPMSPSKIVTSPPREGRDGVKSPTPKSKKHLPPAEELVPRHEESPTKPVTPSVPPYLSNLFSPPTPPGTIKQSSAPKEEEKEKGVDPKSTTGAAPTTTSAASTNAASKAGQSVNPRPPSSQRRQQLPPLEISGKETKPRKTDPPQTTNQKTQPQPQPQTPSLTRKTSLPDPPPQSPKVATPAPAVASPLSWLRNSLSRNSNKTSEVPSPQKDNHERKRTSSTSSRFQDHVTNTASGAGTTPSYEFNDSTTKPVLKDSSVSSAAESKVTTSAAASKAAPAAFTRNEPATSEPTPKADSSQTAKAKKAAAKDAKLTAKDTSTTAQNDVPSIDVQAATPAALPESEDPMNAAVAPSTDTSAAAASADKPVESTAESQAAAAPASAAPVASAPAPSDEPSPPAAVASTTDTKQAEPEPVVPAPPPKGAVPAADADASWDFGDGGSDTQKDAAASDSSEIFKDAVHVQAVSDSDDDKPLATLPGKKKSSAAEEPASKPPAETQSKPVPATNSTTGVAATQDAKAAAEIKNADSVAASAEPTPADNSSKDAPAPNADAASEPAKKNVTSAEPATTADTSAPVSELKVDSTQLEQPTSEQPSTIVESGSGPDVKLDEPKEPAKPSDADAKTENVAKKDSDSAQAAKQEDKNSTKKPELHIDLKDGAPSGAAEPTANSAAPLSTPDVEGAVQSSLPKHMQDADESGLTTEGSELGSRPASPLAQKTTGTGKKKGGGGGGKKKKNKP